MKIKIRWQGISAGSFIIPIVAASMIATWKIVSFKITAHFHLSSIPPHFAPHKDNRISSYIIIIDLSS